MPLTTLLSSLQNEYLKQLKSNGISSLIIDSFKDDLSQEEILDTFHFNTNNEIGSIFLSLRSKDNIKLLYTPNTNLYALDIDKSYQILRLMVIFCSIISTILIYYAFSYSLQLEVKLLSYKYYLSQQSQSENQFADITLFAMQKYRYSK